jgi:hypothetical protein
MMLGRLPVGRRSDSKSDDHRQQFFQMKKT